MSKLLSVLALSGNADAAVLQAADDVRAATLQLILHGNSRNITDTADALRTAGAVTKGGDVAKSRKGAILACLLAAHDAAQSSRIAFQSMYNGHKGKPTADMTERANGMSGAIADEFETAARAAIAKKPKALKATKSEKEDKGADKGADKGEDQAQSEPASISKALAQQVLQDERIRTAKRIKAMRQTIKSLRAELAALKQVRALVPTEKPAKRQSKEKIAA